MRAHPLALVSLPLLALACADQGAVPNKAAGPAPTMPPLVSKDAAPSAAPAFEPPPPPGAGDADMHWSAPAGWVAVEPSSSMRRAQYKIPGAGGDAELAVFYFGPGQGGDPQSNAERWAGQFKRPDGSSALPDLKTSPMKLAGRSVLLVEVTGTYDGGMTMTAAPATPKPGYALLGAVVEGPDANWFFKMTGPEATVRLQREPFLALLNSIH